MHAITPDEAAKRAAGRADRDHDGIPDTNDACPDEPETENGFQDQDGCPDIAECVIANGPLGIEDRILFARNSAVIPRDARPLLDAIAATLLANRITVEVAGHRASAEQPAVSRSRAQRVVDYLVAHGVDRSRLTWKDYGSTCPHVRGAKVHALNRRVDFRRVVAP